MNKIYKTKYNAALGAWVAVPEIAKGRGKNSVGQGYKVQHCFTRVSTALSTLSIAIKAVLLGVISASSLLLSIQASAADASTDSNQTGADASATGKNSLAVGKDSKAQGEQAHVIGYQAKGYGTSNTVFGTGAIGYGSGAMAIGGFNSSVSPEWGNTYYLPDANNSKYTNSTAIDDVLTALPDDESKDRLKDVLKNMTDHVNADLNSVTTAKNKRTSTATVAGRDSIAVGNNMNLRDANKSIALGTTYKVTGTRNIVLGAGPDWNVAAVVQGEQNIAIGSSNYVLGEMPKRNGSESSPGTTFTSTNPATKNTILGSNNVIFNHSNNNTIIGSDSSTAYNNGKGTQNILILGSNVRGANANNSVYVGSFTKAFTDAGEHDGVSTSGESRYTGKVVSGTWQAFAGPGKENNGVVTVGAPGKERRIQNVAAGLISATSTDAINGSQLYTYASGQRRWEITTKDGNEPFKGLIQAANGNYYPENTILDKDGNAIGTTDHTNTPPQAVYTQDKAGDGSFSDSNGNPIEIISSVLNPAINNGEKETTKPIITANIKSAIVKADGSKALVNGGSTESGGDNEFLTALRNIKNENGKAPLNYGVNVEDLQNLSNSPMFFAGDNGTTGIKRKLGEKLKILGEANKSDLTDKNIGTVEDATDGSITVKLSKKLTGLDSVATNTLTATTSITTSKVTGLTAPTGDSDATNKEYVDAVKNNTFKLAGNNNSETSTQQLDKNGGLVFNIKGDGTDLTSSASGDTVTIKLNKSTTVAAGDNKVVTSDAVNTAIENAKTAASTNLSNSGWVIQKGGSDVTGGTDSKVNPDDTVNFANGAGTTADVTAAGNAFTVKYNVNKTTLTTDTNGSVSADTGGDNFATGESVANAINSALTNLSDKKLTFAGDFGSDVERKLGSKVNIVGGVAADLTDSNIGVEADGADKLTIKLAKNLTGLETVTVGDTKISDGGLEITGGPSIKKNGIDAGGKKITNVAAGTDDTDAVNFGQLKPIKNKVDNLGNTVTNIFGGNAAVDADGNVSTSDIGGTGADNINDAIKKVVSDANDAAVKAKTEVKAGDNIEVVTGTGNKGQTVYTVKTKKDVAFDKAAVGNVVIDGKANTITGLEKGAVNRGSKDAVNGSQLFGTADSIAKSFGGTSKVNPDGTVTTALDVGGKTYGDVNSALNAINASAGKRNTVTNGKNIVVTPKPQAGGTTIFEVATADDLTANSFTAGDTKISNGGLEITGGPSIKKNGIDAGGKKITNVAAGTDDTDAVNFGQLKNVEQQVTKLNSGAAGVVQYSDAANPNQANGGTATNDVTLVGANASQPVTIHNVGEGRAPTDAVNVGQLYGVAHGLNNRINDVDDRAKSGVASAMATAGLPQVYLPGKSMVAAAASVYRGEPAIAVGVSAASDNGKWVIKGTANANRKDSGVTVGVGYQW